MKKFLKALSLLLFFVVSAQAFVVSAQAAKEPLKDYMFRGMPNYELWKQERNFEQLKVKSPKPEGGGFVETTYEGNRVHTWYNNYKGSKENRPSNLQIVRNYQAAVTQLGGKTLYEDGRNLHASFSRNDKQYYMVVESANDGEWYRVWILQPAELQRDVVILSAQAAKEPSKDYMFRGMPNYELWRQERNFEQLKIKSPKPEGKGFVETTYEGNRVHTWYNKYKGSKETRPSNLQIVRNYQAVVTQLGGKTLYEDGRNLHASFSHNKKQYYMVVESANDGEWYRVWILEPAELQRDVVILDADTIVHKLEKEGHIALYINFDTDKSTIKPESNELIDEVVTALKSRSSMRVKLEGHTDNVGTAAHNKKLSDDRANAVMNAIVAKGIDKSRISAEGFGLDKPIANNSTEEGKAKNRRVELVKQ
ncbi:MAG: OmpA family protein [Azoarcus sp.]|jgi:flagellar motor protein MotB|nr:OmpA family protein [Azoarcus sp.]